MLITNTHVAVITTVMCLFTVDIAQRDVLTNPPLKIHMHTSYLILVYIQQICAPLPAHSLNFLFL